MTVTIEIQDGFILRPVETMDKIKKLSGRFDLVKQKKTRTSPQNRYIHGYLFPQTSKIMSEALGIKVSPAMAKEILKMRCAKDFHENIQEWIVTPTSKMSTVRFMRFIEDCLKYIAIKYNEYLETPDEYLKKNRSSY